jgi:hypothetical protein
MVICFKGVQYSLERANISGPETSACWDMCDVRVISTADALSGSYAYHHNFQLVGARKCALCRKFLVSLQSPDRHCCNTSKYWSAINTQNLCVLQWNIEKINVRESWEPVVRASASYHCSWRVWLCCCLTMRRKRGGALSCMNHVCYWRWRGTCCKSTGKSFTKIQWYTAIIIVLSKTTGPKIQSPKLLNYKLIRPYLSKHWFLEMCWQGHVLLIQVSTMPLIDLTPYKFRWEGAMFNFCR